MGRRTERRRVGNWDSNELCGMQKKLCMQGVWFVCVCVRVCVNKSVYIINCQKQPPQPSSANASIPTLTTTTKWEHTQHIRAYILCVSICVWGLFCFFCTTQSETTPSCAESLQYWQRNDHFLAMQKMPSCLEIEPIELTLFNGQTSKPFPQRGCHFWMSWPFLTAFKNLQGLQGVVCQWKEFKDYRGGGNWRRGDANAPLLMGASV